MWIRLHSTFGGQSRVGAGFMEFLHEKNVIRVVGELYKQLPSPPHPSSTNTTSSPDSSVENKPRKQRLGGKESFNTLLSTQEITKRESVRCFRVLTYKKSTQGSGRILVDLLDGSAYSFQVFSLAFPYNVFDRLLMELLSIPPNKVP